MKFRVIRQAAEKPGVLRPLKRAGTARFALSPQACAWGYRLCARQGGLSEGQEASVQPVSHPKKQAPFLGDPGQDRLRKNDEQRTNSWAEHPQG